jgi:hypothetical protein
MGRKVSDDVFRLIRSMHRAEKRHFKIFSKRHIIGKENKYVRLFEAIDGQKKYDEPGLQKKTGAGSKTFADQKNQLYRLILRSLVIYHDEKTADAEIRFLLNCADLLIRRELYAQAQKTIRRAKNLAAELEKFALLTEALEREKRAELLVFNLKSSPGKIRLINSAIAETVRKMQLDLRYNALSEEMFFILAEETFVRSEKNKKRSKKIITDPLLRRKPAHATSRALFNFHRTHSLYAYSHADFNAFHAHCLALVELIELQPGIHAVNQKAYIVAIQNLLIAQKNLKRFDDMFVTLRKLKKFQSGSVATQAHIFAVSHDIELTTYIDTGRFEKGALLANPIEEGLKIYKEYVPERYAILFSFNIAYTFFGSGNYRQALNWLNRVINYPSIGSEMPSMHHLSSLVLLLVHYELGNTDLLDYRIRSISKTFGRKNELYELETLLLNFLSKAIITSDKTVFKKLLRQFVNGLDKLHAIPAKRTAFSPFDFLAWAKSKLSGKSMSQEVQERS